MLPIDQSDASLRVDEAASNIGQPEKTPAASDYDMHILRGWERRWVEAWSACYILILAIRTYGSITKAVKVLKALYSFKKAVLGGIQTKIAKVNGKYYHSIYAPAFPSEIFDKYIEAEFNRISSVGKEVNRLSFIFFAVTSKCPLKCEHCFEWNNLNKPESFSPQQLKGVISKFQGDGISQFHLSGGEPMVRIKDVVPLIADGSKESEFYILTSGFNFTAANAQALKQAGLTGVVISLDHYKPEIHNSFRGFKNSFMDVIRAIRNAQEEDLVIVLTLCVTREFVTIENLIMYMEFAKRMKVPFVQILEPKPVGHYEGRDVLLDEPHFNTLDQFYRDMNFDPAYRHYPIVVYHGYHLRRLGCLSGGNRSLYIDSQGFINACPFCHTKTVNIKDFLIADTDIPENVRSMGCSKYPGI